MKQTKAYGKMGFHQPIQLIFCIFILYSLRSYKELYLSRINYLISDFILDISEE